MNTLKDYASIKELAFGAAEYSFVSKKNIMELMTRNTFATTSVKKYCYSLQRVSIPEKDFYKPHK